MLLKEIFGFLGVYVERSITEMNFKEKDKMLKYLEEKSYEEDLDEKDFDILNQLSYDKDVYIRAVVAAVLVESKDDKGEEILLRLTKDHDWLVRADACDSLCISKSPTTYQLLKKIAREDTSSIVRGYAIISLKDIAIRIHKEKETIEFLKSRLTNEKAEFTRINIYSELYCLGQKEYLTNLLEMANSKRYKNRSAVVSSMEEIVNVKNKDIIYNALLQHREKETAWSVICEIDKLLEEIEKLSEENQKKDEFLMDLEKKAENNGIDSKELHKLEEISYDKDSDRRNLVARILMNTSSKEGEKILQRLAKDKDLWVRIEACDSLYNKESFATYELLKHIAKKDTNGMVRGYAISSLGDVAVALHQQNDVIEFLEKRLLKETVEFTKMYIYTVLYNLGKKKYLTDLLSMLNTKRYKNRCEVIDRLIEVINDSNKETIYTALLEHKKIEKTWVVVYRIDRLMEEIKCREV